MVKQNTINDILKMKGAETIVSLTAYDCVTATLLDRAGCDIVLVGDSLGNVLLGHNDTLKVTMQDMIRHTAAVATGCKKALVVTDMPFLSFQCGWQKAVENAGLLIQHGNAQAVKLEGGRRNQEIVEKLVDMGIPVMGHVGMTPQSKHAFGTFRRFGQSTEEADYLMQESLSLQKAGAFSIVLECVDENTAATITRELRIPTIGIGSGSRCDGQVLVINDLLGYFVTPPPSFAKPRVDLAAIVSETVEGYVRELKQTSC